MPGYPDFRRQGDWDSLPLLVDVTFTARNGTITRGPFYVGLWHAVALRALVDGANDVELTVAWFADAAATQEVGRKRIYFSPLISTHLQARLVNLGPYVRLQYIPAGGGAWTETTRLFPTNRVHPVSVPPTLPLLASQQNLNVGGGGTAVQYCFGYYGGPAYVMIVSAGQPGELRLEAQVQTGVWERFTRLIVAAGGSNTAGAQIPPTACRMTVLNTGGAAGNFDATVTPSDSGG